MLYTTLNIQITDKYKFESNILYLKFLQIFFVECILEWFSLILINEQKVKTM